LAAARPVIERFASVGLVQSSVVLAAQAFMALFPLLMGVVAFAPPEVGETVGSYLRQRIGLNKGAGDEVQQLVATRSELRSGITAVGLIVVLATATSFTRALQRVYENAWQVPNAGLRGSVRGFLWLIGLSIYLIVLSVLIGITNSVSAARTALLLASALALWWLTPFVLLGGRVKLRPLAATAFVTAAALVTAGGVSSTVMPTIIRNNAKQFGAIGAVFSIQSWLVVLGGLIVGGAIVGAFLAQADNRVGAWLRGSPDRAAWRRTPHAGTGAAQPRAPR